MTDLEAVCWKGTVLDIIALHVQSGEDPLDTIRRLSRTVFELERSKVPEVVAEDPSKPAPVTVQTRKIDVFTDGAAGRNCEGGVMDPMGTGYVIVPDGGEPMSFSKSYGRGTNNAAELLAIRDALLQIADRENAEVTVWTDSKYAIGVLAKGWTPQKNQELVTETKRTLAGFRKVVFRWVKGHSGHVHNETANRLAEKASNDAQYALKRKTA